jgi:hypothetical protein
MKNTMFSDEEIEIRFGPYAKIVNFDKYHHLIEVEEYFLEEMKQYPTSPCHDLNANEHPYFDNVNYTNFSDFFMMHPLQPELSYIQTEDALIYGETEFAVDFFSIYAKRLKEDNFNKYKTSSRNDTPNEAVVVLIGNNEINKLCFNKLKYIYSEHGTLAVFKPHPMTNFEDMAHDEFFKKNIHKHINIADREDDVYDYIKNAEVVYTSHWSETAFHALCLGKRIEPIDTFQSKIFGSFSHINKHLFETENPEYVINKMFNDYRCGLVNPKYQKDWKERVSKYLSYIHQKRKNYRFKYI